MNPIKNTRLDVLNLFPEGSHTGRYWTMTLLPHGRLSNRKKVCPGKYGSIPQSLLSASQNKFSVSALLTSHPRRVERYRDACVVTICILAIWATFPFALATYWSMCFLLLLLLTEICATDRNFTHAWKPQATRRCKK